MNLKLLFFLACFYMPNALAEAHSELEEKYRILSRYQSVDGQDIAVLVREGGHLIGQPYQVELRVRCDEKSMEPKQWPIKDSFSVCDLKPESLKINNKKSALAMKTKMADLQAYHQNIENGRATAGVSCQEKTTIKKFSLKDLCRF